MSESKEHHFLKKIIAECLSKNGYIARVEGRFGKRSYDVFARNQEGNPIFIEVYLHTPPLFVNTIPNIKCPKCDYRWETRSKKDMVCCPSCMRKFSRREGENLEKGEKK